MGTLSTFYYEVGQDTKVQTILIGSGRKCMFCRMFCVGNLCVLLTLHEGCLLMPLSLLLQIP